MHKQFYFSELLSVGPDERQKLDWVAAFPGGRLFPIHPRLTESPCSLLLLVPSLGLEERIGKYELLP